ncbi:MAG: LysR family transcriptional regulator [Bacillota bacterium]|nr:LysR family transcriptional regulator [Bacillota bacterium]
MTFSLNYKIWVEKNGQKIFGDGPCDILQRIERTGSLRMAAAEINMSYSQAWKLIDDLERKLGFPLLVKTAGGTSGGGSVLTEEGKEFAIRFSEFRHEAGEALRKTFDKHFLK